MTSLPNLAEFGSLFFQKQIIVGTHVGDLAKLTKIKYPHINSVLKVSTRALIVSVAGATLYLNMNCTQLPGEDIFIPLSRIGEERTKHITSNLSPGCSQGVVFFLPRHWLNSSMSIA